MHHYQIGILDHMPASGRYLVLDAAPGNDCRAALRRLREATTSDQVVVGVGLSLASSLGASIPGLTVFPTFAHAGLDVPSTPASLWCWLRGGDRGELLHLSRRIEALLEPAFHVRQSIDAFKYGTGLDLTGYEDGTENPKDEAALAAALVRDQGPGLDGGSLVAVQQWLHDYSAFESMSSQEQDLAIGRRRIGNDEIGDAPASAHVKRTAQESFDPEAFLYRRSMPWSEGAQSGLVFVAFGHSFQAFAAQMGRMAGLEDGITDAIFRFSRPVTGAYFWCPPLRDGRLDLSVLGV